MFDKDILLPTWQILNGTLVEVLIELLLGIAHVNSVAGWSWLFGLPPRAWQSRIGRLLDVIDRAFSASVDYEYLCTASN